MINVFKAICIADELIDLSDEDCYIDTTDDSVVFVDRDRGIRITITEKIVFLHVEKGDFAEDHMLTELPPDDEHIREIIHDMITRVENAYYAESDAKRRQDLIDFLPKCVEWRRIGDSFVWGKISLGVFNHTWYSVNGKACCRHISQLGCRLMDTLADLLFDSMLDQAYRNMFEELKAAGYKRRVKI